MLAIRTFALLLLLGSILEATEPSLHRAAGRILSNKCYRCHGPDAATRESGLRLDQRESSLSELESGERAIVSGEPERSELLRRVKSDDDDERMPPADLGPPLDQDEIELLEQWIAAGAEFEKHWSLLPIRRPKLDGLPVARTPIDRFLLARIEQRGLTVNNAADRAALIRRVTLALTGLPPSIEDVVAFESDQSDNAYERLVQRLLASPRFGERWARVWLDIARYADSAGYAQDPARTIWRYRDWVIDAYNQSQPFDQFTIEQLAGDLLPTPTNDQLLATAFHRNTMTNSEGGTDDEEFRTAAVVDRVNTTMQVWMGLTMGCAQCHDHKYDDITQADYFRFFAVFNNTQDADRGDESPWLEELSDRQRERREALSTQLAALSKEDENRQAVEKQLRAIRGVRTPIMRELAGDKQRETFIHIRGNFRVRGDQVEAGVPHSLPTIQDNPTRLDVAHWLVSAENPLTARVVVNRYWELLFGRGLVETSEDFGVQGDPPSHPLLLDFLASELIRHGWDTKWLLSEIVQSEAYRRSSAVSAELEAKDPANRWLARGPRFRLSAEMIRDQALQVSGLLSTKMRGPSVRPPRPKLELRAAFGGSTDWEPSQGEDRFRRGLYTSWRRTTPYPSMTTFDAPSREFCTVRRLRTNTPLQALVTLNDPVFVEAAQAMALRVLEADTDAFASQADHAFRLVIARGPRPREVERLQSLHDTVLARYEAEPQAAQAMAGPLASDHPAAVRAAWTVLCNVLLNLDETLAPR